MFLFMQVLSWNMELGMAAKLTFHMAGRIVGLGNCERNLVAHGNPPFSLIYNEAAVVSSGWRRVDTKPAVFTVVAQAMDAATEESSNITITMYSAALVTCLISKQIWFDFHLFVYVHVGDLKESA